MNNHNGEDQAQSRKEMALAVTHEICCSVCGGSSGTNTRRLMEAVAIAQAQAQAEAAYSRQLHIERQMLQLAFGEVIHRMCRVRQRLEVN
uniref:I/LWEQ domain-containing protein n=1 Tax=Haemonchus placei TaxID=6290 RepID=A0A0N4W6F7_HAEPC